MKARLFATPAATLGPLDRLYVCSIPVLLSSSAQFTLVSLLVQNERKAFKDSVLKMAGLCHPNVSRVIATCIESDPPGKSNECTMSVSFDWYGIKQYS